MNRGNRGIFDAFGNLHQMGEQMSKMFGGDFARQWMGGIGFPSTRPTTSGDGQNGVSQGQTPNSFGWPGLGSQGAGIPDWVRGMPGLDGLTNLWGNTANTNATTASFPAVDVYETAEQVIVVCDVPGIEGPSGLQVSVHTDHVVVRGQVTHRLSHTSNTPSLSERHTGSFERVISLPNLVDRSRARAVYKNGQLELRLPKLRTSDGQNGRSVRVHFE